MILSWCWGLGFGFRGWVFNGVGKFAFCCTLLALALKAACGLVYSGASLGPYQNRRNEPSEIDGKFPSNGLL